MTGRVAFMQAQGEVFAVLHVKRQVVEDPRRREEALAFGVQAFGMRAALIDEDGCRRGPQELVVSFSNTGPGPAAVVRIHPPQRCHSTHPVSKRSRGTGLSSPGVHWDGASLVRGPERAA